VQVSSGHVRTEAAGGAIGATAESLLDQDISDETSFSRTIKFEQKKVKEYSNSERQQAQDYIRRIDAGDKNKDLLPDGAELAHSLCGQHLFTVITRILYRNNRQPSAVHRAVARLAHAQYVHDRSQPGFYPGWDAIITYNFDAFMSQALADEGVPSAAWGMRGTELAGDPNSLARELRQGCPWIQDVLHLHGYTPPRLFRITDTRFVFATPQFTEAYGQDRLVILDKVTNEYLENPIHVALYVGCSFDDPCMNDLLEKAFLRCPGRYHYALVRWPKKRNGVVPRAEELREEQARYLKMGVRPIWFDEFAEIPHIIARLE
jgi:hypothetical protein